MNIDLNLYNKQISILLIRFKNRFVEEITFNNLFEDNRYELELNNLLENIKEIINLIEQNSEKNIVYLNEELSILLDNSLMCTKNYKSSINKYKDNIKKLKEANVFEINKIDKIVELFIYKISIMYNMKNNLINYKQFFSIINKLKSELIDSYSLILNNKFNIITDSIYNKLNKMLEEQELEIKEQQTKQLKELKNSYNENNIILVNNFLNNNCKEIKNILENMHNDLLKELSLKNNSVRNEALKDLNNYIITYNNSLFSKILSIFKDSENILDAPLNMCEKILKTYNNSILNIFNNNYSFEKVLFNYYKNIRNKSVKKKEDKVFQILNEINKSIINVIRLSVIDVFKENYNDLTKKVYLNKVNNINNYEIEKN